MYLKNSTFCFCKKTPIPLLTERSLKMAKAKAKVTIENRQNEVRIPAGTRMLIRRCCEATLQTENFPEPAEIDVSFVDNEQIHELNLQFRH